MWRGDEAGGGRLPGDDVNYVVAVEIPRLAQEGLVFLVVVGGIVDEPGLVATVGVAGDGVGDGPAGEGPGAFLYVVLAVVGFPVHAHAHGEQFQQFPAPVLVNGVFVAHAVVQVENHGRVAGQAQQQVAEAAKAMLPEHVYLQLDLPAVLALGVAGAEDAVPEQGDLLFQGPLGVDHGVGPVGLVDLQGVHFPPVNKPALQQVHFKAGVVAGVQQVLHRGFVACGGPPFQLLV